MILFKFAIGSLLVYFGSFICEKKILIENFKSSLWNFVFLCNHQIPTLRKSSQMHFIWMHRMHSTHRRTIVNGSKATSVTFVLILISMSSCTPAAPAMEEIVENCGWVEVSCTFDSLALCSESQWQRRELDILARRQFIYFFSLTTASCNAAQPAKSRCSLLPLRWDKLNNFERVAFIIIYWNTSASLNSISIRT